MERRDFIIGTTAVGLSNLISPFPAFALDPDPFPLAKTRPQFDSDEPIPTLAQYLKELDQKGAAKPFKAEIELGNKLLKDVPTTGTPYEIAYRFLQWRKRQVGQTSKEKAQYSYYSREWPHRGNPVIMGFFDATGLRHPKGDTTYWCSSFVCWCIERSRTGKNDSKKIWPFKNGAASASYRSWGKAVSKPRKGDVVVFKRRSKDPKKRWAGHVGFVHRISGGTIHVLGGNQGAQNERNGGEVNIAKFARKSRSLELHSFRRHSSLS